MKVIVDRFEDGFAVCEDENENMVNIRKHLLPGGTHEGDVLILEDDYSSDRVSLRKIVVDRNETAARQKRIQKKFNALWK